jgi:hypothetical protein
MLGLSRPTAKDAKHRGWFRIVKNNKGKVFVPELVEAKFKLPDVVVLTEAERRLPKKVLMERFGVSEHTARDLKRRGWFCVTNQNRDRVIIPINRKLLDKDLSPTVSKIRFRPRRVVLLPDEMELGTRELARLLNISESTARRALLKGWFYVNSSNIDTVDIDRARIAPPSI